MLKLMKQAVPMQRQGLAKRPSTESLSAGAANEELDLHKSWHCLHFMFNEKAEGPDGTALGDAIFARNRNWRRGRRHRLWTAKSAFASPGAGALQPRSRSFRLRRKRASST